MEKKYESMLSHPAVLGVIAIIILAAAFMALSNPPQPAGTGTNLSINQTPISQLGIVRWGDSVTVDYWLYLENGTLFDTSDPQSAQDAGIYNTQRQYEPLVVTVSEDSGMIPRFTMGLVGAIKGVKKSFTVPAAEAYGEWSAQNVFKQNRTRTGPRVETVPMESLASMGINATVNGTLPLKNWNATVVAIENGTAFVRHEPGVGQVIEVFGIPQRVLSFNETEINVRAEPELNVTYAMTNPSTGMVEKFVVTAMDNETLTLDTNNPYGHPLFGKALMFEVIVRSINPAQASG